MKTNKKDNFDLNEKENFAIEVFERNHKCNFLKALERSEINDELQVCILKKLFNIVQEESGIGIKSTIECGACYEKFDITDYEHW